MHHLIVKRFVILLVILLILAVILFGLYAAYNRFGTLFHKDYAAHR